VADLLTRHERRNDLVLKFAHQTTDVSYEERRHRTAIQRAQPAPKQRNLGERYLARALLIRLKRGHEWTAWAAFSRQEDVAAALGVPVAWVRRACCNALDGRGGDVHPCFEIVEGADAPDRRLGRLRRNIAYTHHLLTGGDGTWVPSSKGELEAVVLEALENYERRIPGIDADDINGATSDLERLEDCLSTLIDDCLKRPLSSSERRTVKKLSKDGRDGAYPEDDPLDATARASDPGWREVARTVQLSVRLGHHLVQQEHRGCGAYDKMRRLVSADYGLRAALRVKEFKEAISLATQFLKSTHRNLTSELERGRWGEALERIRAAQNGLGINTVWDGYFFVLPHSGLGRDAIANEARDRRIMERAFADWDRVYARLLRLAEALSHSSASTFMGWGRGPNFWVPIKKFSRPDPEMLEQTKPKVDEVAAAFAELRKVWATIERAAERALFRLPNEYVRALEFRCGNS